jgi:hypothetical protein
MSTERANPALRAVHVPAGHRKEKGKRQKDKGKSEEESLRMSQI